MVEINETDVLIEGANTSDKVYTPTIPNLINNLNVHTLLSDQ